MKPVVIVAAKRTAIGKFGGSLAKIAAPDLGAVVLQNLLAETGVAGEAIDEVIKDPVAGEPKAGDLAGCQVYKFKVLDQLFLLGYEVIGETIYLQRIAPHGNYYRD